jgi:methyl-accepting chemotaxis protein
LARLAISLRANSELHGQWEQIITAVPTITSMHAAALFVQRPGSDQLALVAELGMTPTERQRIGTTPLPSLTALDLLRPDFALHAGRAYRVRPQHWELVAPYTHARPAIPARSGDAWTPADTLLIPLRTTPTGPLVGLLLLDQPDDPRALHDAARETTLELAEALGDLIVMALENTQAYQSADRARQSLESGVTEIMRQVEQARRGNFTAQLPVRDSVLGVIGDLFNGMVLRIGEALTGMREASQIVNDNASAVGRLTATVTNAAQEQARQIAIVTETIRTVAASIEAMAARSVEAATVADTARAYSAEGRTAVEDAVRGMEGLREAALQSTQKVKRLAESLQEIEGIIKQVADFTARTNLLALNASIEAGRAGEFGRGFSVIAQEIRTLALNSADATQQITARIQSIQGEASVVVEAIGEGTERAVEQSDRILDAGTALQAIAEVTQQIAALNEGIRLTAGEEANKTSALSHAMRGILALTDTTRDGVGQIAAAMERFIALAQSLREQITQFALNGEQPSDLLENTAARIPRVDPV